MLPRRQTQRMQAKAERFDGRAVLVDARDDMHVITRALRFARHRQPMRQEVPVLGDQIDQHRLSSLPLYPRPLLFPRETVVCRLEPARAAITNCFAFRMSSRSFYCGILYLTSLLACAIINPIHFLPTPIF